MRRWIKRLFNLYNLEDLTIGGHCGLCGKWIPDQIFPKEWSWGICNECVNKHVIDQKILTEKRR